MLAHYSFNTRPQATQNSRLRFPNLRLFEGGDFFPEQFSPVLIKEAGELRLRFYQWGLVPSWSEDPSFGKGRTFAPVDEALRDPAYAIPVRRNRCLIPADGFFFSPSAAFDTQAFKLELSGGNSFSFAGIYDIWDNGQGNLLYSFAILSVPSPTQLTLYSDKIPMILPKSREEAWLNPDTHIAEVRNMLTTHNPMAFEVSDLESSWVQHNHAA